METTDYVSYPIALALKKAGFDWPCDHYYCAFDNETDVRFWNIHPAQSQNGLRVPKDTIVADAPTLWQVQKWLREVHSLHIQIAPARDGDTEKISWRMVGGYRILELMGTSDFVVAVPYSEINHCSYEAALSAGIAAALELIKEPKTN